ncbi:hypothetical protein KY307_02425 [Candidatus Woesearchaeota archaeon]|nr:hypothetical protein [Candidatus Woesearchaeota archaeon]
MNPVIHFDVLRELENANSKTLTMIIIQELAFTDFDGEERKKFAEVEYRVRGNPVGREHLPWEDYSSVHKRLKEVDIPFYKKHGIIVNVETN